MKLFRKVPLWRIEKLGRGRYHNSPRHWSYCGVIRARDECSAQVHAAFIVGSSQVRVELAEGEEC